MLLRGLLVAVACWMAAGANRTRVSRVPAGLSQTISSQGGSLYGVVGASGGAIVSAACYDGQCPQNGCIPSGFIPGNIIFVSSASGGANLPAAGAGYSSGLCCCGSGNLLCVASSFGGRSRVLACVPLTLSSLSPSLPLWAFFSTLTPTHSPPHVPFPGRRSVYWNND